MQERYLFRGKRVDNGQWITGCLIYSAFVESSTKEDIKYIFNLDEIELDYDYFSDFDDGHGYYCIDPATIGQCTGLKDKNGKFAWEGDIIKTSYVNSRNIDGVEHVEHIVFKDGKFMSELRLSETGKCWALLADGVRHLEQDKSMYMESFEIIGNIHENLEMLKGGRDA